MQPEYGPLVEEFLRLLKAEFGDRLVSILVIGSVARGMARPDSDVDVCLVIRDLPISRYRRRQLLTRVLDRLRESAASVELTRRGYTPDIAAVLYTPEDLRETKPIFLDWVEEGVLLQDDGALQTSLNRLRVRMKELGCRKVVLEDGYVSLVARAWAAVRRGIRLMTNRELGPACIDDACVILVEAEASLEQGHFHRFTRLQRDVV